MNAKEIRQNTLPELQKKLAELKEELFNLRFQHAIHQLDNPQKIVETKRNIAKILTVLTEKQA